MLQLLVKDDQRVLQFPLPDGDHIVGSGGDSHVRIAHPAVSRQHAQLSVRGDQATLSDLESRNGTRHGGRRLLAPVELRVGDTLTFGTVEAELASVAEDDLEAAVTFEPPPSDATSDASSEATHGTASFGALQSFTLEEMPGLLSRIERGESLDQMARAVGETLFRVLPCLTIEVVDRADPRRRTRPFE